MTRAAAAAGTSPVVDAHTHCQAGCLGLLVRVMDLARVDRAVLLAFPGQGEAVLEEAACAAPGRLRVLVAPDLELAGTGGWDAELALVDRLLAHAAGLKLYKNASFGVRNRDGAPISLLAPELEPLWAIARRREAPVLVHCADPADFWSRSPRLRARQLAFHPESRYRSRRVPGRRRLLEARDELVRRHPAVRFVGAHLGGFPASAGELERFLALGPTDTSAALEEVLTFDRAAVEPIVRRHGHDLLWGSDCWLTAPVPARDGVLVKLLAKHVADTLRLATTGEPVPAPDSECGWIAPGLGLTGALRDSILGGNALRVYWSESEL